MRNGKRISILFLALALAIATAAVFTAAPAKLSMFVDISWFLPAAHWGGNDITKLMANELDMDLESSVATENNHEKLNVMLASGDLPDMLMTYDGLPFKKVQEAKALIPLDKYLNKLPNLVKQVGKKTLDSWRAEDGHLYGLGWIFWTKPVRGDWQLAYNQKMYAQLGNPKIRTLEDLEAAMVAAKNKCQTESGKPVIPMGLNPNGITAQIMEAAFGLKTRGPLGYDDKKGPSFKFHDERAWQALRWLNRWWRMGLIDQEGFTQTEEQWRAKTHNGDILFCLGGAYYDMPSWGGMLDKKTAKYYAMAEPVAATFKGEYKNTPFAPWPGGWVGITKNCKNVDLALKYLDWVGSARGQLITHYGYDPKGKLDYLQGKLWEWVPGQKGKKLQFTAEHEKERTADIPSALNKYGYFYTTTLYNGDVISPYEWWADAEPIKEMSKKWCWDASLIRNIIPTPGSPEAIIDTNITDLTTREVPRIVMAESEAESQKIYKAMVEAMDKAGAAKLEAWWQQMWKANKAKLNR